MSLPQPIVPPEVDLRDFPFMPVDIVRLFNSEFHANATDAEWRASVTLWLKSYHQVPAASIPDDDVALARLAELGRDLKTWKKIKAGALRGWKRCSDGRFYHPVVAEKAIKGWNDKLTHHWKRDCDRLRKENKSREKESLTLLPMPAKPTGLCWNGTVERYEVVRNASGFPPEIENFPTEIQGPSAGQLRVIPLENSLKGEGEGEGEGEGLLSTSLRSVDNSVLTDGAAGPDIPSPARPAIDVVTPLYDADSDFFRRCRQVLKGSGGSLGARLKSHFGGNIAKARAAIETASTKHSPRDYVGRILAGQTGANGLPEGQLYDRSL